MARRIDNSGDLDLSALEIASITRQSGAEWPPPLIEDYLNKGRVIGEVATLNATLGTMAFQDADDVDITGGSISGVTLQVSDIAISGDITLLGTEYDFTIQWADPSGDWTLDIPDTGGNDTFVFEDLAQTLTNKTISVDDNTVGGVAASSFVLSDGSGNIDGSAAQKAIPSGVVVGDTDAQTLTNKTIDGDLNTLSDIATTSLKTRTGDDAAVVTGTAGVNGHVGMWNADGDMVDGGQPASRIAGAALTRIDDTNVTVTLGGTPSTALLDAVSLTMGWSGQLALSRGGTGANLSDPGANRLWGWDDTDNSIGFWTIGSGLSYDHATHTLSASGSVPTTITVANEASDTTCFPAFFTAATGDLGPKTNSGLTFNSSTGELGATLFAIGGNADTTLSRVSPGIAAIEGTNIIKGSTGATDNRLLRADGTGTVTVKNSAITVDDDGDITAFGGQITFPATQNPSANANTLDDYEEGTWTVTILDSTFNPSEGQTYSEQAGRYTKIGGMCFFSGVVTTTSLGTLTGTDQVRIGGFPFTSQTAAGEVMGGLTGTTSAGFAITALGNVTGAFLQNAVRVPLVIWDATTGTSAMTIAQWSDDGSLRFYGQFKAAS